MWGVFFRRKKPKIPIDLCFSTEWNNLNPNGFLGKWEPQWGCESRYAQFSRTFIRFVFYFFWICVVVVTWPNMIDSCPERNKHCLLLDIFGQCQRHVECGYTKNISMHTKRLDVHSCWLKCSKQMTINDQTFKSKK